MEITDIRIRKIANTDKMKAVASVSFDDVFVVHDIKILEGEKGTFIAMPSKKTGETDYRDVAHPIDSEFRFQMQKAILDAYEKVKDAEK